MKPNRSSDSIFQEIKETKENSIAEPKMIRIVKYLFDEEDAFNITDKIGVKMVALKGTNTGLPYNKFINILISHQVKQTEALISPVREHFNKHDEENNGILRRKQIEELLFTLQLPPEGEEAIREALECIDPLKTDSCTFSSVVETLLEV